MFKKIAIILMFFLTLPFCYAGIAFDNFQCLNCPGKIEVPIGYVLIGWGSITGWEMYAFFSVLFLFIMLLFIYKKVSKKMLLIYTGFVAIFLLLAVGLYFLEKHLILEAKKDIVGTYKINNETLTIYLENDEVYENKTKEKFILEPPYDYADTSQYHILRRRLPDLYLVDSKHKTVYLLKKED